MQVQETLRQAQHWQETITHIMQDPSVGSVIDRQTLQELKDLNHEFVSLLLSIGVLRFDPDLIEILTQSLDFDEHADNRRENLIRHFILLVVVISQRKFAVVEAQILIRERRADIDSKLQDRLNAYAAMLWHLFRIALSLGMGMICFYASWLYPLTILLVSNLVFTIPCMLLVVWLEDQFDLPLRVGFRIATTVSLIVCLSALTTLGWYGAFLTTFATLAPFVTILAIPTIILAGMIGCIQAIDKTFYYRRQIQRCQLDNYQEERLEKQYVDVESKLDAFMGPNLIHHLENEHPETVSYAKTRVFHFFTSQQKIPNQILDACENNFSLGS